MPSHRHVRIVEIERVAGSAVDERRAQPRASLPVADKPGLGGALRRRDLGGKDIRERLARPRKGASEKIQQAMARRLARVAGNFIPSDIAHRAHERGGGSGITRLNIHGLTPPRCAAKKAARGTLRPQRSRIAAQTSRTEAIAMPALNSNDTVR